MGTFNSLLPSFVPIHHSTLYRKFKVHCNQTKNRQEFSEFFKGMNYSSLGFDIICLLSYNKDVYKFKTVIRSNNIEFNEYEFRRIITDKKGIIKKN